MKSKSTSAAPLFAWLLAALSIAFVLALFSPATTHAATAAAGSTITADPSTVVPDAAQNVILTFFLKLAVAHPLVATLLSLMGTARTWAKPVSSIIHTVVDLTPSTTDNGWLNTLMSWFTTTTTGKTVAYIIDWVTSIKIVPPAATSNGSTV
ncbi:MAG TPA: hypothetical protein VL357_05830 [Rariglobus sp.]|jgi:hypothetical protein|nr:hypothetical protein [Rariglobus sp.]